MRWIALLLLLGAVSGCHTMRFEVSDEPHGEVVFERKSFYLFGLTPTREVDVAVRCPAGVAAIREQTTFVDGFLDVITLGIWNPRSTWYYCLEEGAQP